MRPDRARVVADRVVAGLVGGVRPDPPAARTSPGPSAGRRRRGRGPATRSRTRGTGRRSSRSRRPGASRRRGPSRSSAGPRPRSASSKRRRRTSASDRAAPASVVLAADRGEVGDPPLRVEDVALDLGERDRRSSRRAPFRSRIASPESFQPWLSRPAGRASLVLDEAVAVAVAVPVDPVERARARSARAGRRTPGRRSSRRSRAKQDQPERRRVDRAVVRRVRQLAGAGHLAGPQLVEDLAGLGVAPVVDLGRLVGGEDLERLDRRSAAGTASDWNDGDDRVPAEQRREPRHAGRDVALVRAGSVVDQQAQVGERCG